MSLFTVRRLTAGLAGSAAIVALALPAAASAQPPVPGPPPGGEVGPVPGPPPIEVGPDGQRYAIGPDGQRIIIGPDGRGEFDGPDGRRVIIIAPGEGAPGEPGPCAAVPGDDPATIHIDRDDTDAEGHHIIICHR
ncbi:hypothetical protein ACFYTQ_02950 [Nocardia sp. NPDC004068]|uniref:hypothetical protein n=1 Tax=Nocardia sp. NPDC004068 TaxID=3364303 RepID=UPI003694379D